MIRENTLKEKFKAFITIKNRKYLYYSAVVGFLLVLLSGMLNTTEKVEVLDNTQSSISQYCEAEELRLETILSYIQGVGEVHVMMTLENGVEYRYAADEKQSGDSVFTYSATSDKPSKVEQTENTEQNYILIGSTGDKKPLVVTELSPRVKGVVVVCEGASNAVIRQRVTEAVTTAMGINSLQVCVIQASN